MSTSYSVGGNEWPSRKPTFTELQFRYFPIFSYEIPEGYIYIHVRFQYWKIFHFHFHTETGSMFNIGYYVISELLTNFINSPQVFPSSFWTMPDPWGRKSGSGGGQGANWATGSTTACGGEPSSDPHTVIHGSSEVLPWLNVSLSLYDFSLAACSAPWWRR